MAGVTSSSPTTSYAAPVITSILDVNAGAALGASGLLNPNAVYNVTLRGSNFGTPNFPMRSAGFGANITFVSGDLITSLTYGPSGTEYAPLAWSHVDDTTISVTLGPSTGSNVYFRVSVAGQTSTAPVPSFSYAAPSIVSVSPAHGPCANPLVSPRMVTLATRNPPLLDAASVVTVQIGVGSTWASIAPVLPATPADLLAATNADGTINVSFALPTAWGGQGLGVRLISTSLSGAPLAASPVTIPATIFNYDAPTITAVFGQQAVFAPISGNNSGSPTTSLVFPCPWASTDPRWACDGSKGQLYQVVLLGANFGANPTTVTVPEPFVRHLDLLLGGGGGSGVSATPSPAPSISSSANSSSTSTPIASPSGTPAATATPTPGSWTEASWVYVGGGGGSGADPATIYYWSDSRIIAYTYAAAGQLSVRLTNADSTGAAVAAASPPTFFLQNAPQASAITAGGTNVPTGGGTAAAPLTLTVSRLIAGQDAISITVGGAPCQLIAGVGGGPLGPAPSEQAAAITAAGVNGAVPYYCVVPPGQGSSNPVLVTRTTAGQSVSAITTSVSYAPPVTTSYAVYQWGQANWVTHPLSTVGTTSGSPLTVRMPTNGSLLMVLGANLGTAPALTISAGSRSLTLAGPAVASACPRVPSAPGSCWQFAVPAGQGTGEYWGPAGYSVVLSAGDQVSSGGARFR